MITQDRNKSPQKDQTYDHRVEALSKGMSVQSPRCVCVLLGYVCVYVCPSGVCVYVCVCPSGVCVCVTFWGILPSQIEPASPAINKIPIKTLDTNGGVSTPAL